jgi:preprotein translocase subunit SecG
MKKKLKKLANGTKDFLRAIYWIFFLVFLVFWLVFAPLPKESE